MGGEKEVESVRGGNRKGKRSKRAWKSMNWKNQRIIQPRGYKTLNKTGSHFSLLEISLKVKHYKDTYKRHITKHIPRICHWVSQC